MGGADDEFPIPTVGDNVGKNIRIIWRSRLYDKIKGIIRVKEGVSLDKDTKKALISLVRKSIKQGKNIEVQVNAIDDILVDGKKWLQEAGKALEKVFNHKFTSGVIITKNAKQGTFLIGSFPTDLEKVFLELKYPKMDPVDFSFPVPAGQKFNLLNVSDAQHVYWGNNGGFFTKVNGPWIDAAVIQKADIIVVSDFTTVYKKVIDKITLKETKEITGFGKEIHRLEWIHGYRFNSTTKMMVPPNKASGLPTITKFLDYAHN